MTFFKNNDKIENGWKTNKIYEQINQKNKDGEIFNFMDGPPFVSSENLHYGHILIGYCKDIILRYNMMLGKNVQNKLGYDCHGLPIEMVVNKILNINSKQDVEELGINIYNKKCKETINSFSGAWETIYDKIGRQVDYNNEYKTMDINFMESVWWVFKQLWDKNLVYRGYKIMPFSTACGTSLSNFEASNCYKDVTDMSIYVKFKLASCDNTFFIVWTTTPWTLPANLSLCINSEIIYMLILDLKTNEKYIISELSAKKLYPNEKDYERLSWMSRNNLTKEDYIPIFNYYSEYYNKSQCTMEKRNFKVVSDDFVTADSGTGIVHMAPAFGEDDFRVCIRNHILQMSEVREYSPIDDSGCFTDKVPNYKGKYFSEVNKLIIDDLSKRGLIFKKEQYKHSYPHCWRTDTPLIYKAVDSYFINVTSIKDDLVHNNNKVNWIPEHIGRGRFHQWISNAKDWGISRSRFFGTPIPIWISDDRKESICIGSIEELFYLAELVYTPTDLHREFIDNITIPSREGRGLLRRIPDVFDCWFESGCVPYGQIHYPFENPNFFDDKEYLSDFICEGIDQTRGWFYTLMVISTALFNKPAFKNVMCAGLILAKDGKKMSKRLNNYTDPHEVIEKYGSDALRIYLTSSPASMADSFKFNEEDIIEVNNKLIQLESAITFFKQYLIKSDKDGITINGDQYMYSDNIMDRWIIMLIRKYRNDINDSLEKFELYKIRHILFEFIENLTNWYIKLNKYRFKEEGEDKESVMSTLSVILEYFIIISSPFIPFLTEKLYSDLGSLSDFVGYKKSIHLESFPLIDKIKIDKSIINNIYSMQYIFGIVRKIRSQYNITTRKPLESITIINKCQSYLDSIKTIEKYLIETINCLKINYERRDGELKFVPNKALLGKKYKKDAAKIIKIYSEIHPKILLTSIDSGDINVMYDGIHYTLTEEEYSFTTSYDIKLEKNEVVHIDNSIAIIVNTEYTNGVHEMYCVRLFIRCIQDARKDAGLNIWDKICIFWDIKDTELEYIINQNIDYIEKYVKYKVVKYDKDKPLCKIIFNKDVLIEKTEINIRIHKCDHEE